MARGFEKQNDSSMGTGTETSVSLRLMAKSGEGAAYGAMLGLWGAAATTGALFQPPFSVAAFTAAVAASMTDLPTGGVRIGVKHQTGAVMLVAVWGCPFIM